MPPRRRPIAPPLLLAAAAATSLAGVLAWAWYALAPAQVRPPPSSRLARVPSSPPLAQDEPHSQAASTSTPVPKRAQTGPKPSLTLATPLVRAPRPRTRLTGNSPPRRTQLPPCAILDRIAAQYTLHLVLPTQPFPASALPPYGPAFDRRRLLFHETSEGLVHVARVLGGTFVKARTELEGTGIPGEVVAELELARLVKDVAAFVGHVVVVGAGEQAVGKGVKTVDGWEELCVLLDV